MGLFNFGKKASKQASFEAFYRSTQQVLVRHLRALGITKEEEMEDLVQNTYLEAHKSFDSIKNVEASLPWLLTIGRRQFYLYLNAKIKQRRRFPEYLQIVDDGTEDLIDEAIPDRDQQIHCSYLCQTVMLWIDAHTDARKRDVLRSFFLEDASLKEISEKTGVNASTITTWVSRFRLQAMERITDLEGSPDQEFVRGILKVKEAGT